MLGEKKHWTLSENLIVFVKMPNGKMTPLLAKVNSFCRTAKEKEIEVVAVVWHCRWQWDLRIYKTPLKCTNEVCFAPSWILAFRILEIPYALADLMLNLACEGLLGGCHLVQRSRTAWCPLAKSVRLWLQVTLAATPRDCTYRNCSIGRDSNV